MEVDFKQLNLEKENNFKERLKFVEYWANYVKTHPDQCWSEQQNLIINSQLKK
jgi:hypothetical protein